MSATVRPTTRRRIEPMLVLGLVLVAVGVVLMLDRAGIVDAGSLAAAGWPLVFVGIGLWWLYEGNRVAAGVAVAVGGLLLLITNDVLDTSLGHLILPIVLIGVGLGALDGGARMRRAVATGAETSGGHGVRWAQSPTATAVFGDARITVADHGADRAAVTAISVFGDVEVAVPAGWRVVDRTTALFGTVRIPTNQPTYAEAPVVELHGLAVFGDAKVRYLDDARSE